MQYDKINILSSIAQKEGKYLGKLAFLLWSYDYEPEEMIVLLDSFVQMKICAISLQWGGSNPCLILDSLSSSLHS